MKAIVFILIYFLVLFPPLIKFDRYRYISTALVDMVDLIVHLISLSSFQADSPALPSDLSGNTFSHVFGTHVSR